MVTHQTFWQGRPFRLIGFAEEEKQAIVINFLELFENPRLLGKCKKLHPVFVNILGTFSTYVMPEGMELTFDRE